MPSIRHFMTLIEAAQSPAKLLASRVATMNLPAKINVIPLDDDTVELTNLLASDPGQGAGRTTMQAILSLADELGVTLEAYPMYDEAKNGLSQENLVAWYRRLGFEDIPSRDPSSDTEYDEYLVRKPRS